MLVLHQIGRDRAPATDIVPIETRFHHQHAIGFFHDRVIERNRGQIREASAQRAFPVAGRAHLRNEIRQLRRVAIEFAQDGRDRPDKHPGVPAEIAVAHEGVGQLGVWLFAKTNNPKDVVRRAPSRQR